MFSNGTEYIEFMAHNCGKCPHYVHYDNATESNPVCIIEEQIALSGMTDNIKFPYEWMDENGHMSRYDCRKKNGKESKTNEQRV